MPRRDGILFSFALHIAVVALFFVHLHLFQRDLPEETPIVVELVNVAPETHATEKVLTPPTPKKPDKVAQAEPPKPEPPKPAPPKPEAKPQPPKKDQDVAFDALLKTLAKRQLVDKDAPADKAAKPTESAPKAASTQPIAPLGAQLTTSEIDLVRQQIERCWVPPVGARDAKDLIPEFRVTMTRDGTVRGAELMNERGGDAFFQAAADSARRAILNNNCHGPLKFPPDKYEQWQSFTITFDPKDIT
jgi:type IV secretory pathway VirB10-like protein